MEYMSDINIDIPQDISLAEFILQKAECYKDRPALINELDGRQINYTELVRMCRCLARGLHHHGVRHGDVIAVFAPNCIEYPIIFLGIILCGATVTCINAASATAEVSTRLQDAGVKYVFATPELKPQLITARADNTTIKDIFLLGEPVEGCKTYSELLQCDAEPVNVSLDPMTDCCILNYSSGTTGKSKGVLTSHYNWIADILRGIHPSMRCVEEGCDVTLIQRPLFHPYGQIYHITIGLYQGMTQILPPDNTHQTTLQLIGKYKVTFLAMTPIALNGLIQSPIVGNYDTSSLRTIYSAASPLAPGLYQATKEKLGTPIIRNVFGMTEVLISLCPRADHPTHTLGGVMANGRAKIIDLESGRTLGCKESGELVLKGPTVCLGYHNRPDAMSTALTKDGWFRTGDIGYFDENGNCHIQDRLKELIKYGPGPTLHVAPAEVEAVILSHPGVHQVAVVGRPDPDYPHWSGDLPVSELPTAFVIKNTRHDVTDTDICNWVKERMSDRHYLRGGVIFTETLPMSASGKMLRRILRDKLREEAKKSQQS